MDVTVAECTRPGFGFEVAAVAALSDWEFEPATWDGVAVDSYTIVVGDFVIP